MPVTVVEAGPCVVTQVKTAKTDGYEAIQVGFGELSEQRAKKLLNKPELGHFKKAEVAPTRYLREFRFEDISSYKVGDVIRCDVFAEGDKVDAIGISKGHGYSGVIQRWNQHTGPMAHGSKYHRGVGSWAQTPIRPACSKQAHARPVRLRARDRAEPRDRQGGCRAQPHHD